MDLPETVSVRRFREFNKEQKQELYETLLEIKGSIEQVPRKSLRKTLELSLAVLQYKGEQTEKLQKLLDKKGGETHLERRLNDENDRLQRMLEKLESEKETYKQKIKELTEEIFQLQTRLQEAAKLAEISDKDSSDPLSELDKQEELLRKNNEKNKLIKRLLRENKTLQDQNGEQLKTLMLNEREMFDIKEKMLQLSADITQLDSERNAIKQRELDTSIQVKRLEGNLRFLEEERKRQDKEMEQFIEKSETKQLSWMKLLNEKDKELNKLRGAKADKEASTSQILEQSSEASITTSSTKSESDTEQRQQSDSEITKMRHLLEVRNKNIEELEQKLKSMAAEMMSSTQLMNQISAERAAELDTKKPRACCKQNEENLRMSNERCQQLTELLERAEEDNLLKSKQALHSINALEAFKRGDDGLVPALRKCAALEQKLAAREKELRGYVLELNTMHEVIQENSVLRKRLKIPDDVEITAKNFAAKERNKDKMIERLKLKLATSEEMRLQLKLEKSQLRKEILNLEKRLHKATGVNNNTSAAASVNHSLSSEIGEVPDSAAQQQQQLTRLHSPISNHAAAHNCDQCRGQGDGAASTELQTRYEEVLYENETLRTGMYEILEKLRDYNASSDHITIDAELLKQIIEILPNRNASSILTPKRLQHEIAELRTREQALREMLKQNPLFLLNSDASETGELNSVQSMRDIPELPKEQTLPPPEELIDSATRPTTPNEMLDERQLPVIVDNNFTDNTLQQQINELQIYRKHYEELMLHLAADGNELKRINAELMAKLTKLELSALEQRNSYDYMRVDYDKVLSAMKQAEMLYINERAELKQQLQVQNTELNQLKAIQSQCDADNWKYNEEEYQQLEQRNAMLSMQLAHIVQELLSNEKNELIQDLNMDYGIIKDDYQLDYVTAAEYEQQRTELKAWREKHAELLRKNKQLEGLMQVSSEQIQTQQKLLNEITDNHINLRHLVADLQSSTEEKLLLAKMQRDLDAAKTEFTRIELERNELKQNVVELGTQLKEAEKLAAQTQKDFRIERRNKDIKIKFLQKSLFTLKEKYAKFTPLIFLNNFVIAYKNFMHKVAEQQQTETLATRQTIEEIILAKLAENTSKVDGGDESQQQQMIKLIKTETQHKLLEENYHHLKQKYAQLQDELSVVRLQHATETEHWQTIVALFGGGADGDKETCEEEVAAQQDLHKKSEIPIPAARKRTPTKCAATPLEMVDKQTSPIATPVKHVETQITQQQEQQPQFHQAQQQQLDLKETEVQTSDLIVVKTQAVQTLDAKDHKSVPQQEDATNDDELKRMQEALQDANKRIMELEKSQVTTTAQGTIESEVAPETTGVVEKTILSLHTLLMEKDNAINKYQDMLQTEREQNQTTLTNLNTENETMRSTINNLNFNIKTKDMEIIELKAKLEVYSMRRHKKRNRTTAETKKDKEKVTPTIVGVSTDSDASSGDNSLHDLTDERLEQMFDATTSSLDKSNVLPDADDILASSAVETAANEDGEKEKQDTEELKEVPTLLKQIKELRDKLMHNERMLQAKEDEISILKEKLKLFQEREKTQDGSTNAEIEHGFRLLLQEKDKHIHDLMETLKTFHDDQQRYINDTNNYSADQITKLAVDLNRAEATNQRYQTQLEVLNRQISILTQREQQARELNQSLRTQLNKCPVVSIKTELNSRVKIENLQKRVQKLETELDEKQARLRRQESLLEAKRTRSANEVGLWEKQKRWQQNAEKLKTKLDETEMALEKTRSLLQAARTTIARLEKDKQILEQKVNKQTTVQGAVSCGNMTAPPMRSTNTNMLKCCRTPSCPNLQHVGAAKFIPTPSESPETCTGPSSECSSPAHHNSSNGNSNAFYYDNRQPELIEALKARIELQQRKINKLECKRSSSGGVSNDTFTSEMEERMQLIESQNLRLESKNLELQLENNVLKQSDATERHISRIKHLEEYILALKEEIARLESRRELCKCSGLKVNTQQGQSAESTILSLRNIVEKLRSENKYLKDGRRSIESRASSEAPSSSTGTNELYRLQQMYAEAMDKVALLQNELGATKAAATLCNNCHNRSGRDAELEFIKEQLNKKIILLQKAKVLLARSAAKEKLLKEQLMLWKRKCSELQNVPVIDEISEE